MNKDQKRLLSLLKEQKINRKEFILLNKAINSNHLFISLIKFLFNPFGLITGLYAIIYGVVIMLCLSIVSWQVNIHFIGVVSFIGHNKYQYFKYFGFMQNFIDLIIIWLLCSIVFISISKILKMKSYRIIDFFAFTALAKFPFLLWVTFFLIIKLLMPNVFIELDIHLNAIERFIPFIIQITIYFAIIWQFVLYFNAYKESSGFNGKKLWVGFILSMVFAEIIAIVLLKSLSNILSLLVNT